MGPQARQGGEGVTVLPVIIGHVAYPFLSSAMAGVSRRLSASAARARDKRCRSASALIPHTAAASLGVKPSWPTSSRTSRYAVRASTARLRGAVRARRPPRGRTVMATLPGPATASAARERTCPRRASHGERSRYRLRATVKSHGPIRVSGVSLGAWRTRRSHVSSSRSSASVLFRLIRSRNRTPWTILVIDVVERAGIAGAEPRHEQPLVLSIHQCHNPPAGHA